MAAHWTARPRFIFREPGWVTSRGAEAHNARAAFELAATYDPIVIRQLGNNSARPDLALARAWYQRARDWGSPDAPKQLEALASADR